VIFPLVVWAALSCWLFSIDPMTRNGKVTVDRGVITSNREGQNVFYPDGSNFVTRLRVLGYNVLIPPYDPPEFLSNQSPEGPDYYAKALRGWEEGRFYWWSALAMAGLAGFMRGGLNLLVNWTNLLPMLAGERYAKDGPPFSARRVRKVLTLAIVPFVSGGVGGLLFFMLVVKGLWSWHHQPHALATFGPPMALLVFGVSATLEIGLLGRLLEEDEREWWAKFEAVLLLAAVYWVALFVIVLYVPWLIHLAEPGVKIWFKSGLALGWLGTSFAGAIVKRNPSTENSKGTAHFLRGLIAYVAPWVFLTGLVATVSILVNSIVNAEPFPRDQGFDYWAIVALGRTEALMVLCCGSGLFALLTASLVDVNLFSLHNMYANRLIRAYLGASRKKKTWSDRWCRGSRPVDRCGAPTNSQGQVREEHPISGFDFDDDIPLTDLRMGRKSPDLGLPAYWGPLPLINTALNLVATRELDWQERLAESFVLSPFYCGSESTGYQPLPVDFRRDNMTLGRAIAISGAAADPSMGHHTTTAVTALLTIFNTRLGWWIENPGRPLSRREITGSAQWAAESPTFGGLIVKELAGNIDSVGHWVHLSDGGHFENLGVYELVRRRCRYVIVCDSGCDPNFDFADLANLIRKCWTDFGVRIQLDTAPIKKTTAGLSRWHCAIGKIRYDDVDENEEPGTLVYVKSSMTGDEPPDLQQYARRDPSFPHQTTGDQFFDETQFESYRALGYHIVCDVFGGARVDPLGSPEMTNSAVFSKLRDRWFPAPPELDANFDRIADSYDELQKAMRCDHNLRAFTYELYPELGPVPTEAELRTSPVDRACAELHAVKEMLLLMEKAWIAVKLDGFPEHPTNRGWLNEFQRCAKSATLRRHWPTLRGAFNQEFVRFCEEVLKLPDHRHVPASLLSNDAGERE
jgi:hypothetical protein